MIMHIYVLDEIKNGMQMMKYSMNHWWKFKYPGYAFMSGLLQIIAMYFIALTNTYVTIGETEIIEIIKDLMALTIICDFNNIFAAACGDVLTRKIISDDRYNKLLTVDVTTSKDATGEG